MTPVLRTRVLALLGLLLVVGLLWWAREGGTPEVDRPSNAAPSSLATSPAAPLSTPAPDVSGLEDFTVAISELPVEAQTTIGLIERGGPFPYSRDGTVFGNRERLLPLRERGYYLEFTVPTPGSSDRGARRLVLGGDGELYYTADHYETFRLVRATR